jgi:3-methyladenine DNA glycosylase AlkD
MSKVEIIKGDLENLANPSKKEILQRFFKTGKGGYAEGDIFLGIVVPVQRQIAKKYYGIDLSEIEDLLNSKIHEHRLTALFILVDKFKKADQKEKKKIFYLYLKNTRHINNWDLVDLSAPNIVGNFLLDKDRSLIYKLARSANLWERRISVLATFEFIRNGEFEDIFKISEILINDKHDLIHKAVGWMLREVGKRISEETEETFLKKYYKQMPRTMLRYAIERFDERKRMYFMS